MRDELTIDVAGSYPIKFGYGLCSTGPLDGEHQNGMAVDTYHSWDGKRVSCGGVMSYKDVLRLQNHISQWLEHRQKHLLNREMKG